MRRIFRRKGDLSNIIMTIVFILLALISVPFFRNVVKDAGTSAKNTATAHMNISDKLINNAKSAASYEVDATPVN